MNLNRLIAFFLIIALSPLFLIISIIIFFEDGFPIFFRQKRVGLNLAFFEIYKFRTMKKSTPNTATNLLVNPNTYIIKKIQFLRFMSLDELPNLINIVQGQMNFVGPRPALYNQDDLISLRVSYGIHLLKPGITGLAQINGRDNLTINDKVKLEYEYLKNKTLLLDIKIIVLTIFSLIFKKNKVIH